METIILTILLILSVATNSAWLSLVVYTFTVASLTKDIVEYRQAVKDSNTVNIVLHKEKPKEEM